MNRKQIVLAALVVCLVSVLACSGSGNDVVTPTEILLHYDGNQDSSPNLAGGTTYEAAARFETGALAGGQLKEVQFYILTAPDSCKVKIYDAGTATTPGALLYSADVTPSAASWNTHLLTDVVNVPASDLWISIEFTDAATQPTIGCDPGPADPDGRWLYGYVPGTWERFFVNVNWNIRGLVEITG